MRAELVCGVNPFSVRLRVLHVLQPQTGGVPAYVQAIAGFQADHGWEVHIAGGIEPSHTNVTIHDWTATRYPASGLLAESRSLRGILAAVEPDVVVLHSAKAGMVGRLVLAGRVPTVYVPHAWSYWALRRPLMPAAVAWERIAARWTSAIVPVSYGEARDGVHRKVHAPFFVVPNPVATVSAPASRERARSKLGLADGPIVVCIGRIQRQKGQDVLARIWSHVRERVPGAELLLVGEGSLGGVLVPGITEMGRTDRVADYLAAANMVVMPSRWEGMSLVMLEAMAAGRSVVATRCAGTEVITWSRGGSVVRQGDDVGLVSAIVDRLNGSICPDNEGALAAEYVSQHHGREQALLRMSAVSARAYAFGASSSG